MRVLALSAAILLAIAAACSSFDTNNDEPTADGGSDVATADVSSPSDAGTDANEANEAAVPFCNTVADASFCWSFDEQVQGFTAHTGPRMTTITPFNGATYDLVTGLSPPKALELRLPLLSSDAGSYVGVSHGLPPPATNVSCEIDIRLSRLGQASVSAWDMITDKGIFSVHFQRNTATTANVFLSYTPNGKPGVASAALPLAEGGWFHFRLTTLPAKSTVELSLNGNSQSLVADGGIGTVKEARPILIGDPNSNVWVVHYDNFFCRYD